MMTGKKFLIVAASIGSGHVKAAEAIAEAIKSKYPDSQIDIVDFTEWSVSWATAFMKWTYLLMLKIVPNLYEVLYKFTGGRAGGFSVQWLISFFTGRDIEALVKKYRPDALICTHPFPAGAASRYKKGHKSKFLFATLITDYSVHQMWIYPNVDCYFVARESMKNDLISAGLVSEGVFVTGIPVKGRFLHHELPARILREMNLSSAIPVVLIMGGGLGLGGVETALHQLELIEKNLQILVVAGKNERLKERVDNIAGHSHHKIISWGVCSEVPELMAISSLLITKPGALTITEALISELPLLLHDPIPGPETDNAVYAARRGAAVWARSEEALRLAVDDLINNEEQLLIMKKMAMRCSKPCAAQEIAEHIAKEMKKKNY